MLTWRSKALTIERRPDIPSLFAHACEHVQKQSHLHDADLRDLSKIGRLFLGPRQRSDLCVKCNARTLIARLAAFPPSFSTCLMTAVVRLALVDTDTPMFLQRCG
jgi:hypothetical protein